MKALLATIAILSGLTLHVGDAVAERAAATPENEAAVLDAVVEMFSPISVTADMIERVEFCRYRIDRLTQGYQRTFDFTMLNDVFAFVGLTGDHATATKANIIISGRDAFMARDFTCLVGDGGGSAPHDCESEYTITEASVRQFKAAHSAAAEIVRLCNPDAAYKVCPNGAYRGFECAGQ